MTPIQNIQLLAASYQILKNLPQMEALSIEILTPELQDKVCNVLNSALSISIKQAVGQVAIESMQSLPEQSRQKVYTTFQNLCGNQEDSQWGQNHIGDVDKVDFLFQALMESIKSSDHRQVRCSARSGIESILSGNVGTSICDYLDVRDGVSLSLTSKGIHSTMSMTYYHSKVAAFEDWKRSVPDDLSRDPRLVIKVPEKKLSVAAMKEFIDAQLNDLLIIVVENGRPEDIESFVCSVFDKSSKEKLEQLALEFIEKKDVEVLRILEKSLDRWFFESRLLIMLGEYGKWDQIEAVAKSITHIDLSSAHSIIKKAIRCSHLSGGVGPIRDLFKEFKDVMPADHNLAGDFIYAKLRESEDLSFLIRRGDFQEAEVRLRNGGVLLSLHMNGEVFESLSQSNILGLLELIITNSNREQEYRGYIMGKLACGDNLGMIEGLTIHNNTISEDDRISALIRAVDSNKLETLRFLLNFGGISVETRSYLVPIAARVNNTEMVSLLLAGGEISKKSRIDALYYAPHKGNFRIVDLLLGRDLELPQDLVDDIALYAARSENIEIIPRLFNYGYDISQSLRGHVLEEAAMGNNFNTVKALIGKYNQIDEEYRYSAMLYAIRYNDTSMFAIIFDHGGALSQENSEILLSEAEHCDCHEIVAFLKKAS